MEGYNQQFYHQTTIRNQEKREMLCSVIPSLITNLIRCQMLNTGAKEDKGTIFSLYNKDSYERNIFISSNFYFVTLRFDKNGLNIWT